jgi:hypothetical protein
MQSRKLRKILNDTKYSIHEIEDSICIGSPLCSQLITVDKKTLKIKYALDTFNTGRESINSEELMFIWDKLIELIKNGEIKNIISLNDSTVNMFPVYSHENGEIIEKFTDIFGWPNSTHDGELMYENIHFKTKEEAIKKGIEELKIEIKYISENICEQEKELEEKKEKLNNVILQLKKLSKLQT